MPYMRRNILKMKPSLKLWQIAVLSCFFLCCLYSVSFAVCSDGTQEGAEQCDDGNTTNGDGCSSTCAIEPGGSSCGNGVCDSNETCDSSLYCTGGKICCRQDCGPCAGCLIFSNDCPGGYGERWGNFCSNNLGYLGENTNEMTLSFNFPNNTQLTNTVTCTVKPALSHNVPAEPASNSSSVLPTVHVNVAGMNRGETFHCTATSTSRWNSYTCLDTNYKIAYCGDGICQMDYDTSDGSYPVDNYRENCNSCPGDCTTCSVCNDNDICEPSRGETCRLCPDDCNGSDCTPPSNPCTARNEYPWVGPWTDNPLYDGTELHPTHIRAIHFNELKKRIKALRNEVGIRERYRWAVHGFPAKAGNPISVKMVQGLREALEKVYTTCGKPKPTWSSDLQTNKPIRKVHIEELRRAVENAP